jgi:hypothetical protein
MLLIFSSYKFQWNYVSLITVCLISMKIYFPITRMPIDNKLEYVKN